MKILFLDSPSFGKEDMIEAFQEKGYEITLFNHEHLREFNDSVFDAIRNGLCYNPKNYELFFSLGNYYADSNLMQTYLCYDQAEFYCTNSEDLTFISNAKQDLLSAGIHVPGLSIIILSYNACKEMKLCLESLKKRITLVCNEKNVGFPAGCNQGIKLSDSDNDIFLYPKKISFADKMMTLSPGGFSHSVPTNSYPWLPFARA